MTTDVMSSSIFISPINLSTVLKIASIIWAASEEAFSEWQKDRRLEKNTAPAAFATRVRAEKKRR
jgi:hypothetical protein